MAGKIPSRRLTGGFAVGATMLLSAATMATAGDASGDPLAQAVAKGASLFAHETFGGSGKTCETCHGGGGKVPGLLPNGRTLASLVNAAAIYPRFSRGAGQVITLEGQIRQCIQGGLAGAAPSAGSPDLVALAAYLGSIGHGQAIEIGGAPK